jgi:hypothetical protein
MVTVTGNGWVTCWTMCVSGDAKVTLLKSPVSGSKLPLTEVGSFSGAPGSLLEIMNRPESVTMLIPKACGPSAWAENGVRVPTASRVATAPAAAIKVRRGPSTRLRCAFGRGVLASMGEPFG